MTTRGDPPGASSELPTAPLEPTTKVRAPDTPTVPDDRAAPDPTDRRVPASRLSDEEVLARLQARDRIGRFAFIRNLGEGGMGIISLAYDEELDRRVAIKVIRSCYCDDPEIRRRFVREAQALARLSPPNIVTIYEVGEHAGRPFLAMERIDGSDLRAWLRRERRPQRAILRLLVEAGRGLAAAHAAGIVHRDFKPANVLVGDDGRARVVDFGLARASGEPVELSPGEAPGPLGETLTLAGRVLGTPAYMAPEQLLGAPVGARSDQYAFAIATYEARSGVTPSRSPLGHPRGPPLTHCPSGHVNAITDADAAAPPSPRRGATRAPAPAPRPRSSPYTRTPSAPRSSAAPSTPRRSPAHPRGRSPEARSTRAAPKRGHGPPGSTTRRRAARPSAPTPGSRSAPGPSSGGGSRSAPGSC